MNDKPKFLRKYNSCSDGIKNILNTLTDLLVNKYNFSGWGYSNKPDVRFPCLNMVFCKIELYPPGKMKMFIRVDEMEYITALEKVGYSNKFIVCKRDFVGKKWIETEINEKATITPLLLIINDLAEARVQSGW